FDYNDWLAFIFSTFLNYHCRIVARAIWALWTARNKVLHDQGVIQTAQEKINMTNYYIRELNVINEKLLVRRVESERWRIPAVQMGLDLGFLGAVIEGDALIVVKKFYANNQDGKGNGVVAHFVAIEGIRKGETTYLLEEVPSLAIDEVENKTPCIILHIG
ncbi:hypothetical protein Gotri_006750, partial [Gossypium trilobum]|nr:hypothetical protein [Gossypium trilobum]